MIELKNIEAQEFILDNIDWLYTIMNQNYRYKKLIETPFFLFQMLKNIDELRVKLVDDVSDLNFHLYSVNHYNFRGSY